MKQRLLITGYDFPPQIGGVASYSHHLAKTLSHYPDIDVHVLAKKQSDDYIFDKTQNYSVLRIHLPSSALISLPFYIFHLKKIISKLQPTAILNPLWFPDGAATYFSLTDKSIPYYVSAHGLEVIDGKTSLKQKIRSTLLLSLKEKVFTSAKQIFPVSNYTGNYLSQLYPQISNKIRVINNGVDLDTFKKLKKNSILVNKYNLEKHFVLLTVSRLLPHKGIDLTLDALKTVAAQRTDFKYFIIGDGPDRERLQQLTKQYQLDQSVVFLGKRHIDDIVDFYNLADLFILPSREIFPHVEGFGLVFLEAAACGTASIGGNSGGIPDAIENLKTGWLVDPTSPLKLAELICQLFESPDTIQKMSESAYLDCQQRSWSQVAEQFKRELFGE